MTDFSVTIVIPTYHRGKVLVETLQQLREQASPPQEVIVVDQTPGHPVNIEDRLNEMQTEGAIKRIQLSKPSITAAMNRGLLEANSEIVLFLDDDIVPSPTLVSAHAANYADESVWAVVGQILQPGQAPTPDVPPPYPGPGLWSDLQFPFNGNHRRQVYNCMAGNLSVRRDKAIEVGGMDEQFKGVAYRFETEFARRLTDAGGKVMFDPAATLDHLQAPSGGTRTHGNHLTSADPAHGVGEYYLAFKTAAGFSRWHYMLQRMRRSVGTRYHLRHPWWIPVKLWGEMRALVWASRLHRAGPKYISGASTA